MRYTAVIRTLGQSGVFYNELLLSLQNQTVPPEKIIVYIAEGYPIPKESLGIEQFVYVPKGMVAQRALMYEEVTTEYILFLDDDLFLEPLTVRSMYNLMCQYDLDVIAPDIFNNAQRPRFNEILMLLSARMCPRYTNDKWGYKVLRSSGYSYRKKIEDPVYRSETNAGAAFLCKKADFLMINFSEEKWMDSISYALGDDQVMFYKMHLMGVIVGTWYDHSFTHLDAGNHTCPEKEKVLIYSDFRFKTIFWHRFIYSYHTSLKDKFIDCISIIYTCCFSILVSLIKLRFDILKLKVSAIRDGVNFINSPSYKSIPSIK